MKLGMFIVVVFVFAAILSTPGKKASTAPASQTSAVKAAVPTSPEEDLRTGNISIKNGVSGECAGQIMARRATPACELEGKRWGDELKSKLANPQWRARFERELNEAMR